MTSTVCSMVSYPNYRKFSNSYHYNALIMVNFDSSTLGGFIMKKQNDLAELIIYKYRKGKTFEGKLNIQDRIN